MKKRIAYVIFSFFCAFVFSYCSWFQLSYIFFLSFYNEKEFEKNFIFTDVSEAFSSILWICCIFCFLLVFPFIIYQLLCFLIPSWFQHEKQIRCFFVSSIVLCWYSYLYVVNQFLIPRLCAFLLEFQVKSKCLTITVQPKIYSYLSWANSIMILAFFIFLGAILFFIALENKWINVLNWRKQRPFGFFLAVLIAAFLSPPEIWSETFLACFFYILSEALVWLFFIFFKIREFQLSKKFR